MSIRKGNRVIAGSAQSPMDLFDWKWADHICNDVQWLRADTFSWQSGAVYQAAYNELFYDIYKYTTWYVSGQPLVRSSSPTPAVGDPVYYDPYPTTQAGTVTAYDDVNNTITVSNGYTYAYNGGAYVSPVTETVAGITVTYYPGVSGRKIVPVAYMSAVENVYTATGVAWYYIIDITNKKFKLPRTKFGVTGYRDGVGNYVAPGLPDHNHSITTYNSLYPWAGNSGSTWQGTKAATTGNASSSNPIYGNSDTVQPPATQMYLYFYVGQFTQTALENTAGITAETINELGAHIVTEVQLPNAGNNYTWYRKYADGWVEQGGQQTGSTSITYGAEGNLGAITLPITMANTSYTATFISDGYTSLINFAASASTLTPKFGTYGTSTRTLSQIRWYVCGMAA